MSFSTPDLPPGLNIYSGPGTITGSVTLLPPDCNPAERSFQRLFLVSCNPRHVPQVRACLARRGHLADLFSHRPPKGNVARWRPRGS
jgi:hypothetical protein